MAEYMYRVVTSNGAGIHTGLYRRCADAKAAAERIVERERARTVKLGPYEIERVQLLDYGGHRYWMRRGSQWVPWDPNEDETVRRPDWIYGDPREQESDVSPATVLGRRVHCPLCGRCVVTTEAPCECGFRFPRGYEPGRKP